MKRAVLTLSGILMVTVFISSYTFASEASDEFVKKNYFIGKLGVMQPVGDMDDQDFDTGINSDIGYGRYLVDHLVLETTLGWYATERELSGSNANAGRYDRDDTLSIITALATIKGEYPACPVDLYAGLGVGLYGATLYADINSDKLGSFDTDDFDVVFGAQAVLGANYNLTDYIFIGLEAMYRITDDVELRQTTASIPVEYSGNLNGYSVSAQLGLRF